MDDQTQQAPSPAPVSPAPQGPVEPPQAPAEPASPDASQGGSATPPPPPLPLPAEPTVQQPAAPAPEQTGGNPPLQNAQKQKILIVEDDQDTREIYEEILKDSGFDVTTAVDGADGLEKAEKGGYNLILLDVMMPKIDGLTFLSEVKKRNMASKNGSIILFTNLSHDPVIKEALSLGAKSFLVKSEFSPDQVVEKVKGFLAQG